MFILLIPNIGVCQAVAKKGAIHFGAGIINFQPYRLTYFESESKGIVTSGVTRSDLDKTFLGINLWLEAGYFLSSRDIIGLGLGIDGAGGVGTSFKLFYSYWILNATRVTFHITSSINFNSAFSDHFKAQTWGGGLTVGPGLSVRLTSKLYLRNTFYISGNASLGSQGDDSITSYTFQLNDLLGLQLLFNR